MRVSVVSHAEVMHHNLYPDEECEPAMSSLRRVLETQLKVDESVFFIDHGQVVIGGTRRSIISMPTQTPRMNVCDWISSITAQSDTKAMLGRSPGGFLF